MNKFPFSVILLAGGAGSRLGSSIPKQYLPVHGKPLALYSFEIFTSIPEVTELVVVCGELYESLFKKAAEGSGAVLKFARPGIRRQDSVLNGLEAIVGEGLICIHDSARPLIEPSDIELSVRTAGQWGASALGVRVKSTIKVCDGAQVIVETPNRSCLWEVQTPQVIRRDLLQAGFKLALEHQKTVTDDVSLVELLGKPVKVVEGSYENIKVTTPEDLNIVRDLLNQKLEKRRQVNMSDRKGVE